MTPPLISGFFWPSIWTSTPFFFLPGVLVVTGRYHRLNNSTNKISETPTLVYVLQYYFLCLTQQITLLLLSDTAWPLLTANSQTVSFFLNPLWLLRRCIHSDPTWGYVFTLQISHLWKMYSRSINDWLAVRMFGCTVSAPVREWDVGMSVLHSPSLCLSWINTKYELKIQESDILKNKYPVIFEKPGESHNNTYSCSESISRFFQNFLPSGWRNILFAAQYKRLLTHFSKCGYVYFPGSCKWHMPFDFYIYIILETTIWMKLFFLLHD